MTGVGEQRTANSEQTGRGDGEMGRVGDSELGTRDTIANTQHPVNVPSGVFTPNTQPSPQSSAPSPTKKQHGLPKQAFVLLALIIAAGAWWLYTALTTVPVNGIVASGTIESEEVNIASEVTGRVVQLLADEGDRVQENQVLAKIDDSMLQLQFRMASTEAERLLLQLQIAKTSIRSPIAGMVSRRSVRAGEVTATGATMMVVTSTDPVELTLYVPEGSIGKVKVGQTVDVRVDSFPNDPFPGEVTFISSKAEFTPRNVQTQKDRMNLVFAVKVRIPNQDQRLKPGMPADATILGVGGQASGASGSVLAGTWPLAPDTGA